MINDSFDTTPQLLNEFYRLLDRLCSRLLQADKETWKDFDFPSAYVSLREKIYNSADLPLSELFKSMNSTPLQEFTILTAVAPHYQKKYEGIFAKLNGNPRERWATPQLVSLLLAPIYSVSFEELYESTLEYNMVRRFFVTYDKKSFLAAISSPLIPRTSLLNYIFGVYTLGMELEHLCQISDCEMELQPIANAGALERAVRFADDKLNSNDEYPSAIIIDAPKGGGKSFAMTYLANRLQQDILCINCRELLHLSSDEIMDALDEVICHCLVWKSLPALEYFDIAEDNGQSEQLLVAAVSKLTTWLSLVILSGEKPYLVVLPTEIQSLSISLSSFSGREQQTFWSLCSAVSKAKPAEDVNFEEISRIYSFSPSEIEKIILSASAQAVSMGKDEFNYDMIKDAVRLLAKPRLTAVASLLKPAFKRADLMISAEAAKLFTEAVNSAKYARTIREEWGFDKKLPYGSGISILFYGPPGTGKTMAAQVLADELGLDAYRIDLSQVVDKYIGETEKKLSKIFAAAQNTNAILFFDEADVIFGKRTEVKDSKDKYANVETAFLLQKIEEHNGISIMATNIAGNFDNAFKRRINYLIPVYMPDEEMRLKLWESAYPEVAPVDRSGFPQYAEKLELSGSNIKNIAVASASLAMAENSTITREHIVKCIKQEYMKMGQITFSYDIF